MSTGTTTLTDRKTSAWLWPALFSLVAFAANSVLCRLALKDGAIDPVSFTMVRLASGALFLLLLIRLRNPVHTMGGSWWGGLALFLYAFLFSTAYLQLGAGVGALLLFGAVQITMFGFAWYRGEHITVRMLVGMLIAFAGLLVLLLPGVSAPPLASALLMALSGVAWAVYTLLGKGSPRPLADTAGNFARSLPCLVLLLPMLLLGAGPHLTPLGLLYALGSGVLASGAGYAVWYGVVRQVSAQQAATLQLSVPVIAALGGVALIGEPVSLRLLIACVVVLGGIALALAPRR
ncbi:DMT family transporter [Pseudomonas sp. JR33AA]|uniref:DMT family transporter n=1 Tax=Pseudomonas sp. JR33AA TaxID=2899113 RepID=UPI001F2EE365|nr:DMT family transporter [Pseudomonas sp. JR33AA]MCE5979127.1 DMT family transporter [Pseudomonas sp. JR33AA]